jgi:hypothetical protein
MLDLAHLTLLLAATATSGVSVLYEWSTGGLFIDLYLLSRPASILLVYNSLWAVLFPVLYIFVVGATTLLATSFVLFFLALCVLPSSCARLKGAATLGAATCLSVAVAATLTGVLIWVALSILPPGLWGGRWGRGSILYATSLALSSTLLFMSKRRPSLLLPPPLLPTAAAAPPQAALPLARVVAAQDKAGALGAVPVYQQQGTLFAQSQRNMGHS